MSEPVTIGAATLYQGDCREILPTIGKVDAVVTDPPFGIEFETGHRAEGTPWQGTILHDNDVATRDDALFLLKDIPALVFGSRRRPMPLGTRMVLIWDKGPALGMGALDLPWKPSFEEIYVLGKGFFGHRDGAVIYCPPVQSMAKNGRVHPNEKPVRLLEMLLRKCPPGRVCDPFMGSGSSGLACLKAERPFIGIELDPRYFDIACKRIEEAQRQSDLFIQQPVVA